MSRDRRPACVGAWGTAGLVMIIMTKPVVNVVVALAALINANQTKADQFSSGLFDSSALMGRVGLFT